MLNCPQLRGQAVLSAILIRVIGLSLCLDKLGRASNDQQVLVVEAGVNIFRKSLELSPYSCLKVHLALNHAALLIQRNASPTELRECAFNE
jgi:hypothetical protein